jgi:hypothetical protein
VDFIASRARVGASARQNSEIKCVHCSDAFEPRHTFNAPTTNRSLGNTQCELNERREHPAKSACIRVVADSPSRPWAHCSSPHHLCTRSAHRRLPRKVPLRKFPPRRLFLRPLLPHQRRLSLRRPPRLLSRNRHHRKFRLPQHRQRPRLRLARPSPASRQLRPPAAARSAATSCRGSCPTPACFWTPIGSSKQ